MDTKQELMIRKAVADEKAKQLNSLAEFVGMLKDAGSDESEAQRLMEEVVRSLKTEIEMLAEVNTFFDDPLAELEMQMASSAIDFQKNSNEGEK